VEIKTGRGTKLRIKPPLEYSEDFEPYESMSTERNSDDPLHYSQVGLASIVRACQSIKCEWGQVSVLTRAFKCSI